MGTVGRGGNGGGVQEEFSFQTDGREQGGFVPASLQRGNKKKRINAHSFIYLVLKVIPIFAGHLLPCGCPM